jgi:hypothetical protein
MIKDDTKLMLLAAYEAQFVGILLQHGVAKYIKPPANFRVDKTSTHRFDNIVLDPEKLSSLKDIDVQKIDVEALASAPANSKEDLSEENLKKFVTTYRYLFPAIRRGTPGTVLKKLKRFLKEYPTYSLELIYEVTKTYIETEIIKSGEMYIKSANNIMYKKIRDGEEMLLLNLLEAHAELSGNAFDDSSSSSSTISGSLNLDNLDNYKDDLND